MRMRLLVRGLTLTAFILLTSTPLAAQQAKPPAPAATAEGTIRELLVQYDSAWRRKNVAAMGELLAPTYLFFTSTGEVGTRSQSLADLGAAGFRMGRLRRSEIAVRFTGAALAVVSSRWETEGLYDGAAFKQNQRCGLVWTKSGGTWQIVSEHCIDIPVSRSWREAWEKAAADSARADSVAKATQ
jgi:ketosteroid isomerase-like protein